MADNVQLNTGSGGAVLATDDVGGVHYQIVKQAYGALDAATLVSTSNPLPVGDAGGSLTVDVGVALPAGDNNIGNVDLASAIPAGTNNIGDVDVLTLPALPAGSNNIGDVDVLTVVPGTGATNLGKAEDSVHTSADVGVMALAVRRDADTSLVDATGDYAPLIVDANGYLKVEIFDGGGSHTIDGSVSITGAIPAGTANIGDVDIASIAAGDNNIGNVDVVSLPALPAGTNNIGDVDVLTLPAIPAGNNNIGDVDVATIAAGANLIGNVGIGVRTSGGCTPYQNLDVDESEDEVKGSAGQLYFIHAMNLSTGKRYLKIYDGTAAGVVVGSTTPVLTFPLPTQGDANGAGFALCFQAPVAFASGITIAATTGFAVADTGAPGANEVIVNLGYA